MASSSSNRRKLFELLDWSNLPDGILADIVSRLHTPHDFFSFRAVCQNWRSAASTPSPDQSPLLLFYSNTHDGTETFYDIVARRLYSHRLSWTSSDRFAIAYSHGFIITVVSHDVFTNIIFSHPFTGKEIRLPGNPEDFNRIILSARPDSPDCLVFLWVYDDEPFQYLRVADGQWTVVSSSQLDPESVHDMMFFQGELLALNRDIELLAVELVGDLLRVRKLGDGVVAGWRTFSSLWLGEFDGSLLSVGDYERYGHHEFVVCLWNSEKKAWEEIDDLGDKAVFVCSSGNAVFISTAGLEGLWDNCVYFTRCDTDEWVEFSLECGSSEVVVFDDLGVSHGDGEWSIRSIWVFPDFC